ncbi:MAG: ABC transporter permease [Kiritimatiellaeota bacterium]|nr:ABC transporter permease [Kiritimatiellota bacterium]
MDEAGTQRINVSGTPAGAVGLRDLAARLRRRPTAMAALCVILLYGAAAFGTWGYTLLCRWTDRESIAERARMEDRYLPPSTRHWLGTDYRGRDVLWRSIFATRTAFQVGILAGAVSIAVGVSLGALGGYFGGAVDAAVVWVYSTFAAMPSLLFILSFSLVLGRGTTAVYLGIGLTSWVGLCRVIRAEFIRLRSAPYVEAARAQGIGHGRIILRHILPNALHLVIVFFTIRFAAAIMTEVIVSFLGLGVQLEPSWGVMIAEAKERLWQGVWWELAGATTAMFGLVLAVNILGDALRDVLDPRLRGV